MQIFSHFLLRGSPQWLVAAIVTHTIAFPTRTGFMVNVTFFTKNARNCANCAEVWRAQLRAAPRSCSCLALVILRVLARITAPSLTAPLTAPVYTRLYSLRLSCRIVSFTAANTNLMFSVSAISTQCQNQFQLYATLHFIIDGY